MRRAKRKRSNRFRRKHLDKLARAKLARWAENFKQMQRSASGIIPTGVIHNFTYGAEASRDLYLPPPELVKIREKVQALIKAEKKRIRQTYLITRTGKSV